MADLREVLRAATTGLHERLEALPFFQALHAGSLPKPAIVSFLRCLSVIHAVHERSLSQVSSPFLSELIKCAPSKLPLLSADLKALGAAKVPSVAPAIRSALEYGAEILVHADNPLSQVGILYVLEGSQNGGIALKQAYAHCLDIPKEQLSYIGCYGNESAAHWEAFVQVLNALRLDDDQAQQVAGFAVDSFERIGAICAALYPYKDKDLTHHIAGINFEAGDHAMPQAPLEIALALRAGKRAWDKYPYLARRFGDRGKRFTHSDSCWLVTLTHMPVATATKSLEWLRTVLASRGIPTVILEGHLRMISQELAVEFPDQIDMRTRFDRFLGNLEAERHALRGIETASQLIEQFDQRFQGCSGVIVNSAAQLITSAWIDERCGIAGSLAAARDWFGDAERFSSDWITNVNELVAKLDRAGKTPC